jgi:hypothetical protein
MLTVVVALFLVAPSRGVTQIVALVDQSGQRLYVSAQDTELRAAVFHGGVSAGVRLVERRRRSLGGMESVIESVSREYAVDPALVRAMIEVESAWNPRARSRKGALGLMQLLPETGKRFGVQHLFDPEQSIIGGVRYLHFLLDRYSGDLGLVLAAYNAGEKVVDSHRAIPPYPETRDYVTQVEARYEPSWPKREMRPIYALQQSGTTLYANY